MGLPEGRARQCSDGTAMSGTSLLRGGHCICCRCCIRRWRRVCHWLCIGGRHGWRSVRGHGSHGWRRVRGHGNCLRLQLLHLSSHFGLQVILLFLHCVLLRHHLFFCLL